MIRSLLVALFFVQATSLAANAQQMSARHQVIMATALRADGWLTEQMHKEFWATMPPEIKNDPKAQEQVAAVVGRMMLPAVRFQRETWTSIRLSLNARRVVKTPDFDRAAEDLMGSTPDAATRKKVEAGIATAIQLMAAASSGKPMDSAARGSFYVNAEMIEEVLAGIDGSAFRFGRLVAPAWTAKSTEATYSRIHASVLWEGPFQLESQDLKIESGKSARVVLAGQRLSEVDYVQIGFMSPIVAGGDPAPLLIRVAAASFRAIGIHDAKPLAATWRGRSAAEGSGKVSTTDGTIYMSIRVVEAPEHGGLWQFVGVTHRSLIEASTLRTALEQATQLKAAPIAASPASPSVAFDDADAQLRVKQAASAVTAAAQEVDELRKSLIAERARTVVTAEERDLNRETINILERKLAVAEERKRERDRTLREAQEARKSGLSASPPPAPQTIYYGSRAGMEVSIVSKEGIDTVNAIIRTKHTRENSAAFCRHYLRDETEECIQKGLRQTQLKEAITANCVSGEFTDFGGRRYRFLGSNPRQGQFATTKYAIMDIATREIANGSSASGYQTNLDIFGALCPGRGPFL